MPNTKNKYNQYTSMLPKRFYSFYDDRRNRLMFSREYDEPFII